MQFDVAAATQYKSLAPFHGHQFLPLAQVLALEQGRKFSDMVDFTTVRLPTVFAYLGLQPVEDFGACVPPPAVLDVPDGLLFPC